MAEREDGTIVAVGISGTERVTDTGAIAAPYGNGSKLVVSAAHDCTIYNLTVARQTSAVVEPSTFDRREGPPELPTGGGDGVCLRCGPWR